VVGVRREVEDVDRARGSVRLPGMQAPTTGVRPNDERAATSFEHIKDRARRGMGTAGTANTNDEGCEQLKLCGT
jgi:hypothetical protein